MEEFLAQTAIATIAAYICFLLTQPKIERIKDFNQRLEKLHTALTETNNLAIQYWSSDSRNPQLEASIVGMRTELGRLTALFKNQVPDAWITQLRTALRNYFKLVTGSTFQQASRQNDMLLLMQADSFLRQARNEVDSGRISITLKSIFLTTVT